MTLEVEFGSGIVKYTYSDFCFWHIERKMFTHNPWYYAQCSLNWSSQIIQIMKFVGGIQEYFQVYMCIYYICRVNMFRLYLMLNFGIWRYYTGSELFWFHFSRFMWLYFCKGEFHSYDSAKQMFPKISLLDIGGIYVMCIM